MRAGGFVLALGALAALAACKREPSFDERYAGAQKAIHEKAAELDKDMATRAAEAEAIVPDASERPIDPDAMAPAQK